MRNNVTTLGLDGCKAGWITWSCTNGANWQCRLWKNVHEVISAIPHFSLMLIDIPIGLPDSTPRTCDQEARKLLTRVRSSSVFPVPTRPAIYASTYEEACLANQALTGKKISKQSWFISPKIREVDELLIQSPAYQDKIREAHPEVVFLGLAGGIPMHHSKKILEGSQERIQVMEIHLPGAKNLIQHARKQFLKKEVATDDLIDALALAISANMQPHLVSLPPTPKYDAQGLRKEIVYPKLKK
ncbi:MAG: DUF429 domain-containing protein [Bacteroidota bacterium]